MIHNNIAFTFFITTRGHYGRKDIWRETIYHWYDVMPTFEMYPKFVHIKISDGEEKLGEEIKDQLEEIDFKVLTTQKDWKHNDSSHAVGFYEDMLKLYSDTELHKYKYSILHEDDWLWKSSSNLSYLLNLGRRFLDENLDALCVRVNDERHKDKSKSFKASDKIYGQRVDYTPFGTTMTFQPTILRTLEWYHALRLINKNKEVLKQRHCELVSGDVMKNFSDSKTPFYFFDPDVLSAEHIGGPYE